MMIASSHLQRATCVRQDWSSSLPLGICLYVGVFLAERHFHNFNRWANRKSETHCLTNPRIKPGASDTPEPDVFHHHTRPTRRAPWRGTLSDPLCLRFPEREPVDPRDPFISFITLRLSSSRASRCTTSRETKGYFKARARPSRSTQGEARPQLSRAS